MWTRIITGLVGIAAAVGIITKGGWVFAAAVLFLAAVGWHEYHQMAASKGYHVYYLSSGVPAVLMVAASGYFYAVQGNALLLYPILLLLVVLGFLFIALEGLIRHCQQGEANWLVNTGLSVWAMVYCGLLFAQVINLRAFGEWRSVAVGSMTMDYGEALLWIVLLGTWSSDTFAYFFGRAFGKHPFCSVSPKKSMEGAVAGFIGCVAVTAYLAHSFLLLAVWKAVVLALCVAIFAPLGDLIESIVKRSLDIKDSGKIFPGHGGVLDRFDSLLFVAPVAYFAIILIVVYSGF